MKILYSGHVQGVGFRFAARQAARGFEVCGEVRNLNDGRVEVIAEGERSELEAFQQGIRDSGMEAHIREEFVTWHEAGGGFRGFEIVN